MGFYTEARILHTQGDDTDAITKRIHPKARVLVTLPIVAFTFYLYVNSIYPPMKNMLLVFNIWAFLITFLIASFIDLFIRKSIVDFYDKKTNIYPPNMLGVYGNGNCDFDKFFGFSWNKKKIIKDEVAKYFKEGRWEKLQHKKKFRVYITEKALMFYYNYNKDYKTKREIKAMYDEIIKSSNQLDVYDKFIKYGDSGLIEYYTRQLLRDFKFPIFEVILLFPIAILGSLREWFIIIKRKLKGEV